MPLNPERLAFVETLGLKLKYQRRLRKSYSLKKKVYFDIETIELERIGRQSGSAL